MQDEQKYLSPEQVTEHYYKALKAENDTLKQQNEEMRSMLETLREELYNDDWFQKEVADIDNLLTKHKL